MGTLAKYVDKYDHTIVWPENLPFPADLATPGDRERRFEIKQQPFGWHHLIGLRGLAVEHVDGGVIIHGDRNLQNRQEQGYAIHGTVSIDGKRRGAFTSSQMFIGPDGKLWEFAILYVCKPRTAADSE